VGSYGAVKVLAGIDLRVERGSVFSLLGPNGAGKTTTVRILSTLIRADAGHARVAGFDIVRDRHLTQHQPHRPAHSGRQAADRRGEPAHNEAAIGSAPRTGAPPCPRAAGRFDLADASNRRVATYSGGMRRRLDLAASLVGHPSVIFLDEPTTGLDD
jgi:ABC-2 type transport system ATP-binding protein